MIAITRFQSFRPGVSTSYGSPSSVVFAFGTLGASGSTPSSGNAALFTGFLVNVGTLMNRG